MNNMIKKITAFFLCTILILALVPVVSAQESEVSFGLSDTDVTIGDKVRLDIYTTDDVTEFYADVYSNGYVNFTSGVQFDEIKGTYFVSFTAEDTPFSLELLGTINGDAILEISNISYKTQAGTFELNDVAFDIRVRPEYVPIYTKQDLNNIRNNLSGNYILMNDITFTEEDFAEDGDFYNGGNGWLPIGSMPSEPFKGSFYGNGYKITGLKINKAYYFYNGFFGVSTGEVEALRLEETVVDISHGINTGVLVEKAEQSEPQSRAKVDYEDENVWTDPNASANEETLNKYDRTGESNAIAGLICGTNYGTVRESYARGEINGNSIVGGMVAQNFGTIRNCAVEVEIKNATYGAFISATADTIFSKVYDCLAMGSINATAKSGIFGVSGGIVRRVLVLDEELQLFSSGTATTAELYAKSEANAKEITFTSDNWHYKKSVPVPKAISDFIKGETVFGDVNGDGACNTSDLAELKLLLAGAKSKNDANIVNPDVNSDQNIDTTDLAVLKLYLAGAVL